MNPYVQFGAVMARELPSVPSEELSEALSQLCKISRSLARHRESAMGKSLSDKQVKLAGGLAATADGIAQALGCSLVENWADADAVGWPLYLSVPSGLCNDWAGDRGIGVPCC